jgi:hypothetical protein
MMLAAVALYLLVALLAYYTLRSLYFRGRWALLLGILWPVTMIIFTFFYNTVEEIDRF